MNKARESERAPVVVLATAESEDQLADLGRSVVEAGLAACVTVVPGARSIYRWQGRVEDAREAIAIIKTTRERFDDLRRMWSELHPYDVPELIAIPIVDGLPAYLDWLVEST